jgi:hypothetical protein
MMASSGQRQYKKKTKKQMEVMTQRMNMRSLRNGCDKVACHSWQATMTKQMAGSLKRMTGLGS